jgi:hypothetical protein
MSKQQPAAIPASELKHDYADDKPKDWFEVIEPPTNLKKKAVLPGNANSPALDAEALKRAEEALQDLSVNFNGWMNDEVASLAKAAAAIKTDKGDLAFDTLYNSAHNVKGQAHTLGFPLAGLAAASLCRLVDNLPEQKRLPTALVDNYVTAIAAIVREDIRTMEDKMACAIIDKLDDVSEDFLTQEKLRFEKLSANG